MLGCVSASGPWPSMPCVVEERLDVLERQLRRILAAPAGQRRADRLGRFVAGNVVAAEAAVAAERAAGDVFELLLRAIGRSSSCPASSSRSSTFTVAASSVGNALAGVLLGQLLGRERRREPDGRQIVERLLVVGR